MPQLEPFAEPPPLPLAPHCTHGNPRCERVRQLVALQTRLAEAERLVSIDALTGACNFRHFSQQLPQVLAGSQRRLRASSLILMDLDHFKRINDTWGHEIGNQVLKHTAAVMRENVRTADTVCRYGGEEFAVILPDAHLHQALIVAERIRSAIAAAEVSTPQGPIRYTASFGVDVYLKDDPRSCEAFIAATDKLLYCAKEHGRNRVGHRPLEEVENRTCVTYEEREALSDMFGD